MRRRVCCHTVYYPLSTLIFTTVKVDEVDDLREEEDRSFLPIVSWIRTEVGLSSQRPNRRCLHEMRSMWQRLSRSLFRGMGVPTADLSHVLETIHGRPGTAIFLPSRKAELPRRFPQIESCLSPAHRFRVTETSASEEAR